MRLNSNKLQFLCYADGQQSQINQDYNSGNDYFLKQQAARMLNAIQKGCEYEIIYEVAIFTRL